MVMIEISYYMVERNDELIALFQSYDPEMTDADIAKLKIYHPKLICTQVSKRHYENMLTAADSRYVIQ